MGVGPRSVCLGVFISVTSECCRSLRAPGLGAAGGAHWTLKVHLVVDGLGEVG